MNSKTRPCRHRIARLGTLFITLLSASAALASGFQLSPSTSAVARSLGGNGIVGDDLSDQFFNAAGLSLQEEAGFQADLYYITLGHDFNDQGSTQTVGTPMGPLTLPLTGGADNSSSDSAVVPVFYYVRPMENDLTFGLSVTTPFGLSTTYPDDWIGRYQSTEADIKVIDVNPALSKRLNDSVILGGGLSLQYASAKLTQMAPTPTPGVDAKVKVDGDDVNVGFNLGLVITPTDATRFGLAYRSKVSHDLEGDSSTSVMGMPVSMIGAVAPLTLPESVFLTFYHRFGGTAGRFGLGGGIRWTKWSRLEEIRIDFDNGTSDVSVQNWDDTASYGLSLDYAANDRTTLIFSVGWEESPVDDPELRIPQLPDDDRTIIGFGINRDINDDYTVGFAWHRLMGDARDIDRARPLSPTFSSTLTGEYDSEDVDVFSLKVIRTFGGQGAQ